MCGSERVNYLAVHSQSDEHEEEEDGPEGRDGKERHSLGVGNEGQTKFCRSRQNSENNDYYGFKLLREL